MEMQSQATSKLKRQHDDNENDQRKSQRLASSAESKFTTKIIDLNDDCLLKVFGHLDLQSLFNVAVANEYLRPAAREVYKRKFGTKKVLIGGWEYRWNRISCVPGAFFGGAIHIFGLRTSLQFLRCFGSSMTNLTIDYNRLSSKRNEYVHQYISDNCAASLAHIEFQWMPIFKADPFQKAFVNVKEIVVLNTILEQQLQSFAKLFPNLTRLNLRHIQRGESFVAHSFQRLEHLRVVDLDTYHQNEFVADLLRGAQHLKCMDIELLGRQNFPIETLLDMIEDKTLLAELKYNLSTGCQPMPVNLAAAQRIINEHPALVELDLPQFRFSFDSIVALIDQLKSLKKLRVAMLREDYRRLETQLKNKWNSSDDSSYFHGFRITLGSFCRRNK